MEMVAREILNMCGVKHKLQGPWKSGQGSVYYCLIFKKQELEKNTEVKHGR